jgi:hypothetical protein
MSFVVQFKDENSAKFVYFNLKQNRSQYRSYLKEDFEVYRVRENKCRDPPSVGWVGVMLRYLPLSLKTEDINNILI